MSTNIFSKTIITLFATASLSGAAYAQPADEVKFSFKAHELKTSGGIENLYARLMSRAENACTTSGRRSLETIVNEKACTTALATDFIVAIDHPRLTQLFENEEGSVYVAQK